MSKKKRRPAGPRPGAEPVQDPEPLTREGKWIIGGGIALLALGLFVLTMTDPLGRNWASRLAPFLILGAYGVMFAGIFFPRLRAAFQADKEDPPA